MARYRILVVDDEPSVISAIKRILYKVEGIKVDSAESGKEGIEKVKKEGPYAVVVSDLRMPVMDGIQFLTRVKEISPDTVRIILTGYADLNTAIEAINAGSVFRFLTKPSSPEVLINTIVEGVKQYRLIVAEKELLEKTLRGCVKVLVELLSLASPEAFGRVTRIRRWSLWIAKEIQHKSLWKLETSAMLSQLGCLMIPEKTLMKAYRGETLEGEEKQLVDMGPSLSSDLISNIPRMEDIARIILYQNKNYDGSGVPFDSVKGEEIPVESRIIRVATDFDTLVTAGKTYQEACSIMLSRSGFYDPKILVSLEKIVHIQSTYELKMVGIKDLREGMIIGEDVYTVDRKLLIRQGNGVTRVLIEKLKNFSVTVGVEEPIKVFVPTMISKDLQEDLE